MQTDEEGRAAADDVLAKVAERDHEVRAFTVAVMAGSAEEAREKVEARLTCEWDALGVSVCSERHRLWTVKIRGFGDADGLWVTLTSYGMTPDADLKSRWQTVRGVGR